MRKNQGDAEQAHIPSASAMRDNGVLQTQIQTRKLPGGKTMCFLNPSGISFVLRPVSVWPTVHGNTDGVDDEVGRDSDPMQTGPASIRRPAFAELRATLADGDVHAKERVREVGILVDTAEDRAAEVQEKVRKLQRLRLALEQEVFIRVEDRVGPTNVRDKHGEAWRSHEKRSTDTERVRYTRRLKHLPLG
ncbi:hypothetical protein BC628DRAFT_1418021 [Trametes gibbosa]|nr:hypothetical protein BC628DRAFT_1418013 [Trametes gibbosa]KAI0827912.1 hypothetical protein BC628DRAFT_1418021 [Trametes gibbosa]